MQIRQTALPGVLLLAPRRHEDARGWFSETWNRAALAAAGLDVEFVQDNRSLSYRAGTLRGLHFQVPPRAQAKLVRCGQGALFDVAVDLRRGDTYGAWIGVELSAANALQLFVPAGFAHGFVTRAPDTEVLYKCSAPYDPAAERTLAWDSCGIDWGLDGPPVLSDRDAAAPPLCRLDSPFAGDGAR